MKRKQLFYNPEEYKAYGWLNYILGAIAGVVATISVLLITGGALLVKWRTTIPY